MRLLGLADAVLLTSVIAAPAIAEDLLKPGDTISGRLRFFQHQHPNGTWINTSSRRITRANSRKTMTSAIRNRCRLPSICW